MRQAVVTGCIVLLAVLGGAFVLEQRQNEKTLAVPHEIRDAASLPESCELGTLDGEALPTDVITSAKEPASWWRGPLEAAMRTARTPKPLSGAVTKGLAYLIGQQQEDGGWGQGG